MSQIGDVVLMSESHYKEAITHSKYSFRKLWMSPLQIAKGCTGKYSFKILLQKAMDASTADGGGVYWKIPLR